MAEPTSTCRVAVIGLGAVGRAVGGLLAASPDFQWVAGVDLVAERIDAAKATFGDAIHWTREIDRLPEIDAAVVCIGPRFDRAAPTLRQMLFSKAHVVSDCDEMVWPWLKRPHLADVMGNETTKAGVVLLSLGSWPGLLAAVLQQARTTPNAKRIHAFGRLNISDTRPSIQRQIGLGVPVTKFRKLVTEGIVGVPGLGEIVTVAAQAMGRHPMRGEIRSQFLPITTDADGAPGTVVGLKQIAGWNDDNADVRVEIELKHGAESTEWIEVETDRGVRIDLPPSSAADTAAALVDALKILPTLPRGLRTVLDLAATP